MVPGHTGQELTGKALHLGEPQPAACHVRRAAETLAERVICVPADNEQRSIVWELGRGLGLR